MKTILASMTALAVLSGCADTGAFSGSAGAQLDDGTFGNATMNNTLVQTRTEGYTVDLARRFAAEVTSMITFPFDSARLEPEAQAILRQQADWIRQFPEVRFRVYGHTDLVGSAEYNQRLGLRRAQAAVGYLTSLGIDRSRLEAVASFGETQPIVPTSGRERLNRRTVTEVIGFVEDHPMLLNGKYAEVIFREYVASAVPPTGLAGITGAVTGGGE